MGFVAAVCPSCGASIQLAEGQNRCFCSFCGNQIIFEEAVAKKMEIEGTVATRAADFDIQAGCLIGYHGVSTDVVLPQTVKTFSEYAFRNQRITSITLPRVVDWMSYDQFRGISTLRALNYEYEGSNWRSFNGVLYSLKERELIVYPAAHPAKEYQIVEGTKKITITGNPHLRRLTIGAGIEDVTLSNLANLESVVFEASPETFPAIAIKECGSLTEIVLDTPGITSLKLEKCDKVASLSLPGFVQRLYLANCSSLSRVDCPGALDSLWLLSCPITHFNVDDCISLPNGADDVHIESVKASNLSIGKNVGKLRTWIPWKTVTFGEGIERLDHVQMYGNGVGQVILPASLKQVGPDITIYGIPSWTFPNYDHAVIECNQLRSWRRDQWALAGRCPQCGGTFTGLFNKRCEKCGYEKPKN